VRQAEAEAVGAFRKQMMAAFSATAETAAVTTSAQPDKRTGALQGRIKGWWATPPKEPGPLGTPERWTIYPERKSRHQSVNVGEIDDFIAVAERHDGFVGIRANGEALKVNLVRSGERDAYYAYTYTPASGARFTRLGSGGQTSSFIDERSALASEAPIYLPSGPLENVLDSAIDSTTLAHVLLRDGRLLWWGEQYGPDALNGTWPLPPDTARQKVRAMSQSSLLAAALTADDEIIVWNGKGGRVVSRRGNNWKDIAVCINALYALDSAGRVMQLVNDEGGDARSLMLGSVTWIKPAGIALLAGLKDGRVVTDSLTEKESPAIKPLLAPFKNVPPEALDLHVAGRSGRLWPSSRVYWIEPAR
jgi:hypothetical protein